MKRILGWLMVFVCALVFAILVDTGKSKLFLPNYVWLSLNLTLFLFVLERYVGRPMAQFLDSRRDGIAEELENARKQLAEAEEMRAAVVRRLDDVEGEIAQLKERAEADGAAEAAQIAEQAANDEARFLRRAEEEISRREAETRVQLAEDAAALTGQLARELLEKEMTDADRRRVLERSLAAMAALEKGN